MATGVRATILAQDQILAQVETAQALVPIRDRAAAQAVATVRQADQAVGMVLAHLVEVGDQAAQAPHQEGRDEGHQADLAALAVQVEVEVEVEVEKANN